MPYFLNNIKVKVKKDQVFLFFIANSVGNHLFVSLDQSAMLQINDSLIDIHRMTFEYAQQDLDLHSWLLINLSLRQ